MGQKGLAPLRRALLTAVATATLGAGAGAPGTAHADAGSPFFAAPFEVTKLANWLDAVPDWTLDERVLTSKFDARGLRHIYRSDLNGENESCLTCATVQGPNAYPQERPQGDWILFASYGAQPKALGSPGRGGFGGDLVVMRPDGASATRLTTDTDPDRGAPFSPTRGTPYDNYHAYWSPDGRHIAWVHTEARPLSRGGLTWEVMVGDFEVKGGVPSLTNVRVVVPPFGVLETQAWSPDGEGFIVTAMGGYRSPMQADPPGWGNARIYYVRIYGPGASPEHPMITPLTDNAPVYTEQAVFTSDMTSVIMMTDRGDDPRSWGHRANRAAQRTRFDSAYPGSVVGAQITVFASTKPVTDLWMADLTTKRLRRLTDLGHNIPSFHWNRARTKLLWSFAPEPTTSSDWKQTYTARFTDVPAEGMQVPSRTPAWLYGQPLDMSRLQGAARGPAPSPGPVDNAPVPATAPSRPPRPFPHAARMKNPTPTVLAVPPVTVSYAVLWVRAIARLSLLSGEDLALSGVSSVLKLATADF